LIRDFRASQNQGIMANTPITMGNIKRIVQLRSDGESKLKISKAVGTGLVILYNILLKM